MLSRPIRVEVLYILVIQRDCASLYVVHAKQELCDGGFARTRAANNISDFGRRDVDCDAPKDRESRARGIRERDFMQIEFPSALGRNDLSDRPRLALIKRGPRDTGTPWQGAITGAGSRGFHERDERADGKLALCEGDQMRDAHLEIGCCNKTCPENTHHMAWLNGAIAHQLCAEPEALYEHPICDKLVEARCACPNAIDPPCSSLQLSYDGDKR